MGSAAIDVDLSTLAGPLGQLCETAAWVVPQFLLIAFSRSAESLRGAGRGAYAAAQRVPPAGASAHRPEQAHARPTRRLYPGRERKGQLNDRTRRAVGRGRRGQRCCTAPPPRMDPVTSQHPRLAHAVCERALQYRVRA
jgi:hypothetical protein